MKAGTMLGAVGPILIIIVTMVTLVGSFRLTLTVGFPSGSEFAGPILLCFKG
jgi:hypothetical protein